MVVVHFPDGTTNVFDRKCDSKKVSAEYWIAQNVPDKKIDTTNVPDRRFDSTDVPDRRFDSTNVSDRRFDSTNVSDRIFDSTKRS